MPLFALSSIRPSVRPAVLVLLFLMVRSRRNCFSTQQVAATAATAHGRKRGQRLNQRLLSNGMRLSLDLYPRISELGITDDVFRKVSPQGSHVLGSEWFLILLFYTKLMSQKGVRKALAPQPNAYRTFVEGDGHLRPALAGLTPALSADRMKRPRP